MQYWQQLLTGIDGSEATLVGYVLDNTSEIDMNRRRPAVLILPGGGYAFTSDREAEPIAMQYLAAGYHAFILRYSVAPATYPVALLEAAESMTTIRAHADEWHVDPDHIAVLGFSAGGHLAANLATTAGDDTMRKHGFDPDDARPNALMLSYPVITAFSNAHFGSFNNLLGPDPDPSLREEVSIERHIDATTPPVFIWHTIPDDCVPVANTLLVVEGCRNAGVPVEAHLYPTGGHGLSLATAETSGPQGDSIVPDVQTWMPLSIDWLKRTFAR